MEEKEASKNSYVKWLYELDKTAGQLVGGKGANLAEMFNAKLPVPPAFAITTDAYRHFTKEIKTQIEEILESIDVDDTAELAEKSKQIRELIINHELPEDLKEEILEAYEDLGIDKETLEIAKADALNILQHSHEPVFVAVRSSATTEDLDDASFAGQQETYLNVKGDLDLIEKVKRVFASLFTARAIFYRKKRGFSKEKFSLSVIVQKMVDSEKSGVMFSKNPIKENENVVIEAVFGLGEGIVSGKIKPDTYEITQELKIVEKKISDKKIALVRNSQGKVEEVKLNPEKSKSQTLEDGEIKSLANYGIKIEDHYKKPQDIEFALEGGEIYITQSRPITTKAKSSKGEIKGEEILSGLGSSPGIGSGKVKIIHDLSELDKIKKGDVLVTGMTNPDMVVSMQKSAAIVTDQGGLTCHASIVSREMGIPAIVGTDKATEVLKDGEMITVDGFTGKIYKGEGENVKAEVKPVVSTKTKIKVLVDLPKAAERAAKTKAEGIGLMRLEGIIASSGKHPIKFVKEKNIEEYSKIIEKGIEEISKPFKEIWIRTSDIRSDEYANLEGAPKDDEANPMLGNHGIRFSLKNPEIFKAELNAIKNVAEKSPDKKFGFMIPLVISPKEIMETKKIADELGLNKIKKGIMIETPASALIIKDLLKVGVDFVSFGTNDLTQFTLGVDRGNEDVQYLYDETHPAVLNAIKRVIRTCKEMRVESSICGQAASKKEMVKHLIEWGIDSLSVNADAAYEISQYVAELEKEQPVEEKSQKEKHIKEGIKEEFNKEKKEANEEEKSHQNKRYKEHHHKRHFNKFKKKKFKKHFENNEKKRPPEQIVKEIDKKVEGEIQKAVEEKQGFAPERKEHGKEKPQFAPEQHQEEKVPSYVADTTQIDAIHELFGDTQETQPEESYNQYENNFQQKQVESKDKPKEIKNFSDEELDEVLDIF